MSAQRFENGILRQWWNDTTRTYTEYNTQGTQTLSRPYTVEENARADAGAAQAVLDSNQASIEEALAAALTTLQAIIDDTNANVNANPAPRIKDIARTLRRTIRLVIRRYDGTT